MRITAVAGVAAALLLAGCGAGGGGSTGSRGSSKRAAASPSPAAPQLRTEDAEVSRASVQRALARLYRDHPSVATFSAQDVTYTSQSRTRVLDACFTGHTATEQAESASVLACAPLIFFYYEYGKAHNVSAATSVADSIYSYATTQVHGPTNSQTLLDGVLAGWGLPVSHAAAVPKASTSSPAAVALVSALRHAIGLERSVRVTITGYSGSKQPTERIVTKIGRGDGSEVVREGSAYAEIRTVDGAAYVTGNGVGLQKLIGLPAATVTAARGHWLRAPAGSAAAKNLSAENSLASLPASILPQSTDSVRVRTDSRGALGEKTLSWSATAQNGTMIRASLTVSADGAPLPFKEITTAAGNRQVVAFTQWNRPVAVAKPSGAVPLTSAGGA